jgi:hypothetical protein
MTSDDLRQALITIKEGLEADRKIVDAQLLSTLRQFLAELRGHPAAQEIAHKASRRGGLAQDFSIDKFLEGLSNALDVEEKLIGKQGETLIRVCDSLSQRPVLLGILARFM